MDEVLSIDGIDFQIFKYLKFSDLMKLRLCNRSSRNNVSFFSETIFNALKDRYLNTFDDEDNYNFSIGLSHIELYYYYCEIKFISFFLSNKQPHNTFIDTIKKIKIDNYKTKLYVGASNYYELMIYYEKDFLKRKEIKNEEESIIWVKNEVGKWVENGLRKYEEEPSPMDRDIMIYDTLKIF
tara:strand:+ start:627 stop:1172 length:546 start_codon:yes stop_codon:yes gene_type:complete